MKKIIILLLLCAGIILAQESIILKEALVLKNQGMSRRSVNQKDIVEKLIINNRWVAPFEDSKLELADTTITWEKIEADENGWFADENLRSGYASVKFKSDKDKVMILEGMGYTMSYVNQVPRYGNVYQYKEEWQPWEPDFGFLYLPVKIKKGENEFLFQSYYGKFKAVLHEPKSDLQLNVKDITLPSIKLNKEINDFGSVVIINTQEDFARGCKIKTSGKGFNETIALIPDMIPLSVRKIQFNFESNGFSKPDKTELTIEILSKENKVLDKKVITLDIKNDNETYKETFISEIDGSVQYYAVNPPKDYNGKDKTAMFLALHGAAVEGFNHANAYYSKKWGMFISPTNRRPYGFNWEDWGRLDALEVYNIALNKFNIDRERIYLTGHSMGGHGTWHIGGTFPDKFAAIGPSAGWISFWSYRYKNKKEDKSEIKQLIERTNNPSDTYTLSNNYLNHGIYIIHGKKDNNVKVDQSYSMIEQLKKNNKNYIFHEEPDAGHWWDYNDEDGADCVDWPPLFDFFARHSRFEKEVPKIIKFKTASPGISADYYWTTIYDQHKHFDFSTIDIVFEPGKQRIKGTTENVKILRLQSEIFDKNRPLKIFVDKQEIIINNIDDNFIWLYNENGNWSVGSTPSVKNKNPKRFGGFKDAFRHNMIFVYGTNGTEEEDKWCLNKVRYDAEQFWYQGNGSIDIISDKEFEARKIKNRNIILYGNSDINSAWNKLLSHAPVQVENNLVKIGDKSFTGDDLICTMIYPQKDNNKYCIGTVAATGLKGMRLLDRRPYLKPGFTYPDVTIINSEVLTDDESGYKAAGFFGSDWSIKNGEFLFMAK